MQINVMTKHIEDISDAISPDVVQCEHTNIDNTMAINVETQDMLTDWERTTFAVSLCVTNLTQISILRTA
jgi:hypothetical protein